MSRAAPGAVRGEARERIPRSKRSRSWSQLRILRNPAQLLGALEGALPVLVPAVVELAFVFVRPFLRHLMRAVRGAAGPIHEERLVGGQGLVLSQPNDRVVGKVLAQMIVIVTAGGVGMFGEGRVAHKTRFVLRRFPGKEAIEVLETVAGGPIVKGTGRGGLFGGRVVPLAPRPSMIAVILEHLGDGGAALRDGAHVPVPVVRQFGDLAAGHAVVVAPGQQRRTRGRTHRGRVEPIVGNALRGKLAQGRRMNLAAVGICLSGADVVDQHDENVRRILWQMVYGRQRSVSRLLHRPAGNAAGWFGRERQNLLRPCRQRKARAQCEGEQPVERFRDHRVSPFEYQ